MITPNMVGEWTGVTIFEQQSQRMIVALEYAHYKDGEFSELKQLEGFALSVGAHVPPNVFLNYYNKIFAKAKITHNTSF